MNPVAPSPDPITPPLPVAPPPPKEKSPLTDANYKNIWASTRDKIEKNGRWLITEEINEKGYKELFDKALTSKKLFKGTFLLHNFPRNFPQRVDFLMTDRETPVGQIKSEVERISGISKDHLTISFMGFKPLEDHIDFYYGLNCHGRGGENFHLSAR